MVEVLTTFKMSEQTFFVSVSLLDRFFKLVNKSIPASELHLTGMTAMFLASKYEDITPLMMRTIINKIGHGKFCVSQVTTRELDILRTLNFRVGAPTILEFIDNFKVELSHNILIPFRDSENEKKLMRRILLLSKIACCSYELVQLPPSLLAAAIITLSVKMTVKANPAIVFNSIDLKCLIKKLAKMA